MKFVKGAVIGKAAGLIDGGGQLAAIQLLPGQGQAALDDIVVERDRHMFFEYAL